MKVGTRGEEHVNSVFEHLFAHCASHCLDHPGVPAGCKQGTGREACAIVAGSVILPGRAYPQAGRPVSQHYGRDAETLYRVGRSGTARHQFPR